MISEYKCDETAQRWRLSLQAQAPTPRHLEDGADSGKKRAEASFSQERLALDDYVERFLLIDRLSTELRRLEHRLDLRSQFVTLVGP